MKWIGWSGFFLLLCGVLLFPEPYSSRAHMIWVSWTAGCIAFLVSVDSYKSYSELLKNAVIVCLILGGLSMFLYGEPSYDEDGYKVSEGFPTTFDSKAGAGVETFLKLFAGAFIGIRIAEKVRAKKEFTDKVA